MRRYFQGKGEESLKCLSEGKLYYRSVHNKNNFYCGYRGDPCDAKVKALVDGSFITEGSHTCAPRKIVDPDLKEQAEKELAKMSRETNESLRGIVRIVNER